MPGIGLIFPFPIILWKPWELIDPSAYGFQKSHHNLQQALQGLNVNPEKKHITKNNGNLGARCQPPQEIRPY